AAYPPESLLIHGVGMDDVVLHLTDNAPKNRQVAGQYVQHGHAPQGMNNAARLLQYLDELATVDRVAPELCIDAAAGVPHGAQRLRRYPYDLGSFLHDQKSPEEQGGVACEAVVAAYAQPSAYHAEIVVYDAGLVAGHGEQQLFHALHQHGIQLADHPRRPVIPLHEAFAGP